MRATFNNEEHEFHINREHIPFLEFSLGRGLYGVLKDATEARWTFNDVAMIVSFALHGPSKDDRYAISMGKTAARMGMSGTFAWRYKPHPDVIATLEATGHGNYAGLMADVLTETIFGTTAGSDAYGNEVPDAA
jgi:hypothetical protein